jgi:hypothetical protein
VEQNKEKYSVDVASKRYRFKDKVQYLGYTPVSLGKKE